MTAKKLYIRVIQQKRKSCSNCHSPLEEGESIYSAGEYISGKWRTVAVFCYCCYVDSLLRSINTYERVERRPVEIVGYQGCVIPDWMQ